MTRRLPAGYDELPPTVVGFEFEFTPNPLPSKANSAQILAEGTEAAGYEAMPLADRIHKDGYYLSNGGLITSEDASTQAVGWGGVRHSGHRPTAYRILFGGRQQYSLVGGCC